MKAKGLLVLLAMVLVVSLAAFAACAKEEEKVVEEGWQWPETLMLGTSGVGDRGYVVGIAWTTPLGKDIPEMTVRVVVQPDMQLRYIWLRDGTIDFTTLMRSGKPWIETEREHATRDGGPSRVYGFFVSGKVDKGVGDNAWYRYKNSLRHKTRNQVYLCGLSRFLPHGIAGGVACLGSS